MRIGLKAYVEWAEAYLHTKWHLDPSSRLATIHQRHRQDRTDRTDKQTTVRQHRVNRFTNAGPKTPCDGRTPATYNRHWRIYDNTARQQTIGLLQWRSVSRGNIFSPNTCHVDRLSKAFIGQSELHATTVLGCHEYRRYIMHAYHNGLRRPATLEGVRVPIKNLKLTAMANRSRVRGSVGTD